MMLAISLGQIVCSVAAVWFGARTAMSPRPRPAGRRCSSRVGTFSTREVQHFGAPSLITRSTNDVQQVQMLVLMACTIAVSSPIMMVGGVIMALREDVGLGWILAIVVPVLFICVGFVVSRMVPNFRKMQSRIDEVNRVLREQITGIRVVRAFVREPHEAERFGTANDELTDVSIRAGRWMAAMFPLVMLVVNVSSVAVIWFGGHRVDNGQMEVGALTAFLSYLMQILMSVMMATFMLMMIPRASVCGDRIMEVLDTTTSVPAADDTVAPDPALRGHLDLEHVTYAYPGADAPVLDDISFAARPGQTVAVIGSTGAGKSTLVNLVPRLFDATVGVGAGLRPGRPRARPRPALGPAGAGAAEGLPLQRHGPQQPPARQGRRDRGRDVGRPRGRPGPRLRRGASRGPRLPGRPRAAPTSPAASGSGSRSRGRWYGGPGSTCSTTRSRRSTWRPTPGCARR